MQTLPLSVTPSFNGGPTPHLLFQKNNAQPERDIPRFAHVKGSMLLSPHCNAWRGDAFPSPFQKASQPQVRFDVALPASDYAKP